MHSQGEQRALRVLWGVDAPPAHGPTARWTLADVATVALRIADADGLGGVSLAKVAAQLELSPTALYRYVDSKATLVELLVDAAMGEAPVLVGDTWQEQCRAWTTALAQRYRVHPWLADHRPEGMPRQPRPWAWIAALVDVVAGAEVDGLRLALLLEGLVRTFAGISRDPGHDEAPEPWLARVLIDRHPSLATALDRSWSDVDQELDIAIDVVLRGVG